MERAVTHPVGRRFAPPKSALRIARLKRLRAALSFTVRRSLRSPKRCEEDMGAASFNSVPKSAKTDSPVLQASSFGATECACGD